MWKDALLASSRNLRRNVLRGKIWGPPADDDPDDDLLADVSNSSTSSLDSPHNATDGDYPGPHYIRPYRRHRSGRVRGMVESFERSGSFSSDSSCELAERSAFIAQYDVNQDVISQSPVEAPSQFSEPSTHTSLPLPPPAADSPPRSISKRPLPQTPVHPSLKEFPMEDLTVEELLEAEEENMSSSCGARAWEEFDNKPGITVKKLIQDAPYSDNVIPGTITEFHSREKSNDRKQRDERRIVTAIFSPAHLLDPTPSKSEREAELEDQVKSTTLTLEEYKKRLEEVERKVSNMAEVELRLTQKIEKADRENKELQERVLEAERKAAQTRPDNPSRPHLILDQGVAAKRKKVIENMDPQSISALSQYVLLVGMGVCAVVFRVVLKKVIGNGLKP